MITVSLPTTMMPCGPIALSMPGVFANEARPVGDPGLAAPAVDLVTAPLAPMHAGPSPPMKHGTAAAAAGLGDEEVAARAEGEMARAVEPARDDADRSATAGRGSRRAATPGATSSRTGRTASNAHDDLPRLVAARPSQSGVSAICQVGLSEYGQ